MKPPQFDYEAPAGVEEVLELLAAHGEEAKVLAGGQSLVPLMNFRLARPARLIDLNRVESLAGIESRDGHVVIGAMTRHADIERSPLVAAELPLLAQAIVWVGHQQIRNRGTVGGSLAHADPAAELPAVMAAYDATFHLRSARGERQASWREFFVAEFTTTLEPDELLVSITVPRPPPGTGSGFVEFARRHGDFALGGAAALVQLDAGGHCTWARLALLSAASVPVRAEAAEAQLVGRTADAEAISATARTAVADINPTGDIHGSSEYRRQLAEAMAERALTQAVEQAGERK